MRASPSAGGGRLCGAGPPIDTLAGAGTQGAELNTVGVPEVERCQGKDPVQAVQRVVDGA